MGATKNEFYDQNTVRLAELLKAIAHPARITALKQLIEQDNFAKSQEELLKDVPLAQSTKSKHLKLLKKVGILSTRIESKDNRSCLNYKINPIAISSLTKLFSRHLIKIEECEKFFEGIEFFTWSNELFEALNRET